jgi:hypothetical protein
VRESRKREAGQAGGKAAQGARRGRASRTVDLTTVLGVRRKTRRVIISSGSGFVSKHRMPLPHGMLQQFGLPEAGAAADRPVVREERARWECAYVTSKVGHGPLPNEVL